MEIRFILDSDAMPKISEIDLHPKKIRQNAKRIQGQLPKVINTAEIMLW